MHMNRLNNEMMSWTDSLHVCCLCTTFTWSDLNPGRQCMSLYGLRAACRWWLVRSCCDKQEVRCHTCLNLSRLHYSFQCCTLAVAQHCPSPTTKCTRTFNFVNVHLKFTVYGHKHTSTLQTHFTMQSCWCGARSGSPQISYLIGHFVLLYTQLYMCKSLQ